MAGMFVARLLAKLETRRRNRREVMSMPVIDGSQQSATLLGRMGVTVRLSVVRPGYVPLGAGVVQLAVTPVSGVLRPLTLTRTGIVREVHGIALASHLASRHVSDRMASACREHLTAAGLPSSIERVEDTTAGHAGASLAIWAESTTGCVFGADRAGAFGRSSEAVGAFVAETFLQDLRWGATVDRHVADQLVLFAALADGTSRYIVPQETGHPDTNLWLIGQFGARGSIVRREVAIEGLGLTRATMSGEVSVRQPTPTA